MRFSILNLTLAAMLLAGSASAQTLTGFSPLQHAAGKAKPECWPIIEKQIARQASAQNSQAKTTSAQRLLSIATFNKADGLLVDTQHYTWSGNRAIAHYQFPMDLYMEVWDILDHGKNPKIQADSIASYIVSGTDTMTVGKYAYQYNASNRILRAEKWQTLPLFYQEYVYNTAGKVTQVSKYIDDPNDNSNTYPLREVLTSTYNTSGTLAKDSIDYVPSYQRIYNHYQDAANRDTLREQWSGGSMGTFLTMKTRYQYYPSGQLQRSMMYVINYDNNNLPVGEHLASVDSFGYDGINNYPTYHYNYDIDWQLDELLGMRERIYTLNAAGDVTDFIDKDFSTFSNQWDTAMVQKIYYNSFDNADSITHYLPGALSADYRNYTSYLRYDIASGIAEATAQPKPVSITLHPNPATTSITLSVPDFKSGSRGQLMVYDMMGRLLQSCGIVKNTQAIDISRLPQGMYLARFEDGTHTGAARFVKQ